MKNLTRLLTFCSLLGSVFLMMALAVPAVTLANAPARGHQGVPMRAETVTVDVTHVRTVSLAQPTEHVAVYWRDNENASVTVAFSSDGTNFGEPVDAGRDERGEPAENGMTYGAVLIAHGATAVRVTSNRPLAQLTVLGMSDDTSVAVAEAPGMAIQGTDEPSVISRQAWGADPTYMTWAPEFHQTRKLIVHHTAGSNDYTTRAEAESYVRSIYYYHSVTKGWGDIAYNFLIDKFGNVYEGRYSRDYGAANPTGDGPVVPWSVSATASFPDGVTGDFGGVRGGHTYGWNGGTMGVAVLGTYTTETISPAARAALVQLLAWEAGRNGIEPLATEPFTDPVFGATITTPNIGGHRLYVATECPGAAFNADLPSIREEVAAQITPPAPDPTPPTVTSVSPAPGATEVMPTAAVTATFSEAVDPTTVNESTITLFGLGSAVGATVTYDAALRTVELQPLAPLTPSTSYTVTILGGSGGVTDLAGNALPVDETWTFSTAAYVNKIVNPGFEFDANADGRPDSWTSNTAFTRSGVSLHEGSYSGRFYTTKNKGFTIGQTVTGLTAGSPYQFSGWVNIPQTTDQFTFRFNIVWRNATNSTISMQTVTTYSGPTSGWFPAGGSYVAPAGATKAQVNMVVTSLNGNIYVDDIVFR